ncbi:MAG: hypothetical protein Q4C45_05170, partial [Oscillospiraceae bacterium]|nr:hypothetical protein [Oscillospiraceae bacterium]
YWRVYVTTPQGEIRSHLYEHVGIVCGYDGSGGLLIIHCASGANNVVITGTSGFASVSRPDFYDE